MVELRPYQTRAIDDLRKSVGSGYRSPVLVVPTGGGKTLIAADMIRSAVAKGKRCLFLAPRRELAFQTGEKLDWIGVPYGMIMAGADSYGDAPVQIASVATLYRRGFDDDGNPHESRGLFGNTVVLPPADLIVIDEAHANFSNMARKILDQYPDAIKIGLTATPARSDGRGLGEVYDDMVMGPAVPELIEGGYLVPMRYFAPSTADLTKVRVSKGDYVQADLSKAVQQPKLIGDVVTHWAEIASDRQTVVFAVDRKHALALYNAFQACCVAVGYLDGETPNEERAATLRALESREIRVLCSVDVLTYGWDCPIASCAVLARPTKSISRYLQIAGRVLRPHEGKQDAILIDHTGAVAELGFVDEEQPWTLDGKTKIQDVKTEEKRKKAEDMTCPECHSIFRPAPQCPSCGDEMRNQYAKNIEAMDARLREIDRSTGAQNEVEYTLENKQKWYSSFLAIQKQRGYKGKWAAANYREKFGNWPRGLTEEPISPAPEVLAYVRKKARDYAKRMKDQEASKNAAE